MTEIRTQTQDLWQACDELAVLGCAAVSPALKQQAVDKSSLFIRYSVVVITSGGQARLFGGRILEQIETAMKDLHAVLLMERYCFFCSSCCGSYASQSCAGGPPAKLHDIGETMNRMAEDEAEFGTMGISSPILAKPGDSFAFDVKKTAQDFMMTPRPRGRGRLPSLSRRQPA